MQIILNKKKVCVFDLKKKKTVLKVLERTEYVHSRVQHY